MSRIPESPGGASHPRVRRVGGLAFLTAIGSVPLGPGRRATPPNAPLAGRDMTAQAEAAIANLHDTLRLESGLELADLTCYLTDPKDMPALEAVWRKHFDADGGPTRTVVFVPRLGHPEARIEIKAIAAIDRPAL